MPRFQKSSLPGHRCPAIFLMVLVGVVFSHTGGGVAEAGVMLPWMQQTSEGFIESTSEGCGSASDLESPATDETAPSNYEHVPNREAVVSSYLGTGGGASAPVNSSTGQTSLLLAAMFQLPAFVPLMTCLSRHLRERSLQLPRPPLGELLDPPKAGCI